MADDIQKRTALDQLTSAATAPQPDVPGGSDPANPGVLPTGAGESPQPPTLLNSPPAPTAQTAGDMGTQDLEARVPDTLALGVKAEKKNQQQDQWENPTMVQKIGRYASAAAGAPGLTKPGATPEQRVAGIGNILSKIGDVGVRATGSPQQNQQEIERQGQQNQLQQLRNTALYQMGTLQNNQNKTTETIAKDRAAEAAKLQETTRKYEQQGMMAAPGSDPANPHFIDMPPEVAMNNEVLKQNLGVKQAATDASRANTAYKQAQSDALQNPNSLTQQNKVEALRIQALNAGMQYASKMFEMRKQNQESLFNYGQAVPGGIPGTPAQQAAPAGGRPFGPSFDHPEGLNLNNAPDMMLVSPVTGLPIPNKSLAALKPTMQEQNRADFARSAMHSADNIQQLVDSAQAQIGPFSGRIQELMAKAGIGDRFNQELQNYVRFSQSAATAAHTGRFSVPILDKMDKMIGPEMNPDQLKGAVDSIKEQMSQYADAGWKPTVAEYRAWLSGASNKPSGAKSTPNSPGASQTPPTTSPTSAGQNAPAAQLPASMIRYKGQQPVDVAYDGKGNTALQMEKGGDWIDQVTGNVLKKGKSK